MSHTRSPHALGSRGISVLSRGFCPVPAPGNGVVPAEGRARRGLQLPHKGKQRGGQ